VEALFYQLHRYVWTPAGRRVDGGHGFDLAPLTGHLVDLLPAQKERTRPASQLRERDEGSDFNTKTQDKVAAAG
jgi:hypothetical protein